MQINMRLSSIKQSSIYEHSSHRLIKNMVEQFSSANTKQADLLQNLLSAEQERVDRELKIRDFLQQHSIDKFFDSLQRHINQSNLCYVKKNHRLQDGLYIIISGGIVGFFMEEKQRLSTGQRQLREHLFAQLKSGNYSSIFGSQSAGYSNIKGKSNINSRFILLGLKMFDVFQCVDRNFITLQQTVLISIDPAIQAETKYQNFKKARTSILRNNFLPSLSKNSQINQNLMPSQQPFIQILPQLHQNIIFKTFKFRNIIRIDDFGIIAKGAVKMIDGNNKKEYRNNIFCETQLISEKGLIFEGNSYEAISEQVLVYLLKDIYLLKQQSRQMISNLIKVNSQEHGFQMLQKAKKRKSLQNKTQVNNSMNLTNYMTPKVSPKQLKNRTKQLINVCKNNQKFSIIPIFTCLRSLNFSKEVLAKGKTKTQKAENPLVLFDLRSNQIKKSQQAFNKNKSRLLSKQTHTHKRILSRSPTMFERLNKQAFKTCSSSFHNKDNLKKIHKQESRSLYSKESSIINMPLQLQSSQNKENTNISKLYKYRIDKKIDQLKLRTQKPSKTATFEPNFQDS